MARCTIAYHILNDVLDIIEGTLPATPLKLDNKHTSKYIDVVVNNPKLFYMHVKKRGLIDQRTCTTEKWLKFLDKKKLTANAEWRTVGAKHIQGCARRTARKIWLECKSYKEFCTRCGFLLNSSVANEWDAVFSQVHSRKLKTHGGPKIRITTRTSALADLL